MIKNDIRNEEFELVICSTILVSQKQACTVNYMVKNDITNEKFKLVIFSTILIF
jgi:hypothetical protein